MGHDELKGEPYLGDRLAEQRDVFRRSAPGPSGPVERESQLEGRAIRDRFVRGEPAAPAQALPAVEPDGSLEAHLASRLAEIHDTFGARKPAPRGAHQPADDALATYRRLRKELGS